MSKYIDAEKLKTEIEQRRLSNRYIDTEGYENELLEIITSLQQEQPIRGPHTESWIEETKRELQHEEELLDMRLKTLRRIRDKKNQFQQEQPLTAEKVVEQCKRFGGNPEIIQQEQPDNIIQWTGNNLKEVIGFTGKSPRFGEWFKSWEEFETYVHQHNDILKLFCEDGSHYEVPVGAWIVKTPDGYNIPSLFKFVQKPSEVQMEVDLEKFADKIKTFQGRYKYPEIVSIKGAMAFMARMFYQYPNAARQWYDSLPKATMD